jgi:PKD repeat protein
VCQSFNITVSNTACGSLVVGSAISVQINVTNVVKDEFNGYEFDLYYDPTFLSPTSADTTSSPTIFPNSLIIIHDFTVAGTARIAGACLACNNTGPGTIVNINFNILGTGVSPLTLAAGIRPNGNSQSFTELASHTGQGDVPLVPNTADGYFKNDLSKLGPVASFTFTPASVGLHQQVNFTAVGSFDPDNLKAPNQGISQYRWDFGNGFAAATASPFFNYAPSLSGNFSVRLTVVDSDNGFEGMQAQPFAVSQSPFHDLIAQSIFASPNPASIGDKVTVNVNVSNNGTSPENFNLTVSYGSPRIVIGTAANQNIPTGLSSFFNFTLDTSHLTPGLYTLTANVTVLPSSGNPSGVDNNPANNVRSNTLNILPPSIPPVASFTFSPPNPVVGQTVFFDGSRSSDADGSITFWSWNFGDGGAGFGTFPAHTYFASGNYTVTLTVTDTDQRSAFTSLTVPVHSIPPHDVALDSVLAPRTAVSTQIVQISVALENTGSSQVTVNITAYWDSHVAGSLNNEIIPSFGFPAFFDFLIPWDTTGVPIGNHTITARVFLADDPTPADNFASGGQITILPPPVLKLVPSSGTIGTKVVIEGSGFPVPQFASFGQLDFIQVTFDNMTTGFITTSTGAFNFTFDVPLSQPGIHYINVVDETSLAHASAAFQVLPTPGTLLITVKTAAIYFPGDTATVYLLATLNGIQVGPSGLQLQLTLVRPDGSTTTLATVFTASGIYKAIYSIPKSGALGTYTLVASAHMVGVSDGSSIASFEVKPTWLSSNTQSIAGGVTVAGVVGLAAVAWRKSYLRKKNHDQDSSLLSSPAEHHE